MGKIVSIELYLSIDVENKIKQVKGNIFFLRNVLLRLGMLQGIHSKSRPKAKKWQVFILEKCLLKHNKTCYMSAESHTS